MTEEIEDNDDDDKIYHQYPNPNRPEKPLIIQSIYGDEQILQFLLNDFDTTMQAFRDLGNTNPDKIWAYQKIVFSDLEVIIELCNSDNKEYLAERLKHHFNKTREKRVTQGYLKGKFKNEY